MSWTVTVAVDGIVAGTIYQFMTLATNTYGDSDLSDEVYIGVGSFPIKPSSVTKVLQESGQTYITVSWSQSSDTELPVIGYRLNINDGQGGSVYTPVQ